MKRHLCQPRPDWKARVESVGLSYHSLDNAPYWDESACYELSSGEVDALEAAANALHLLCIDAAEAVIKNNWWGRLAIPPAAVPAILESWERDDFSIYGRFDLSFDGLQPPKLLEYNADTPTALLEASVAQWFWLQDVCPESDQFNSIHERLIAGWKRWGGKQLHFASMKHNPEDEMTVLYLRDTCAQAGVQTRSVFVEDLGWDASQQCFVDLDLNPVRHCFKLYPWEWLWRDDFARHLAGDPVRFLEPAWKMLLSNKGLLPILWELFPGHPNLLPAYDTAEPLRDTFVRKPILSREGANVALVEKGMVVAQTAGAYTDERSIFQAIAPQPDFGGFHPVFGLWVVDHEAAGLGIRDDTARITGNLSRFVPHYFA